MIICIYLGFGHRKNVLLNSPDSGKFVFAQMKSRWICDFIGNWSDNLKKKKVCCGNLESALQMECIMRGVPAKEPSFIQGNLIGHFEFFVVVVITHN